jgi:hypothetical protein
MYRYIITILICLNVVQLAAAKNPTALELLDKYAENADRMTSSFVCKMDIHTKFKAADRDRPYIQRGRIYEQFWRVELRCDGQRTYRCTEKWGDRAGGTRLVEKDRQYQYRLWDGKTDYSYIILLNSKSARKNGEVTLRKTLPADPNFFWQFGQGQALRGFFPGANERIDTELRAAQTLAVEPKQQDVNGSKCYVINAKGRGCQYRIWIDPDHSYNIAKAIVQRSWPGWDRQPENRKDPRYQVGSAVVQLSNIRFREVGGVWVPVEADYRREHKVANGDYEKTNSHFQVTEFLVKPDHKALRSFVPDFVRNGALVRISGISGTNHIWRDGKVVDKSGQVVFDSKSKKDSRK